MGLDYSSGFFTDWRKYFMYQTSIFSGCISWLFCVKWIKDFFILQVCDSVIRELKQKGSKFTELLPEDYYLLSVTQIKSHTRVSCFAGYYTSMEQKTVLTSDLMQVSNTKSMASNGGLWGDKGIILIEADKLCSHRLTSLYHWNGEAANQSHFNQEGRTTQGEWGLVIKVIRGQCTAVVSGWQQEQW